MFRTTILQSDSVANLLSHAYLLARSVNQLKIAFGKENGQRNTWETATRTEVQNLGAWGKLNHLADGQRVQHVVFVQVVDVLARNDVYLGVPVTIQSVERSKLLLLPDADVWEIFLNDFHILLLALNFEV